MLTKNTHEGVAWLLFLWALIEIMLIESLKIIAEPDTPIFSSMFYNYTVFFGYFLRVRKI